MRISWINAPDGRVIDSRQGLTTVGVIEQAQTWLGMIGEDDILVMEDDRERLSDVDLLAVMRAADTAIPEPLGPPNPAGVELPEHPDQGCVRCGNPITWNGEAWVHVRDGVVRHAATAALWPGAAIANGEPGQ